MKKVIIRAAGFLTLLLLLPLFSFKVFAEGGKVVRVGWYESAFHQTDPFGRRSGYGYEYQQRIAAYTGWTYEYVEGSWSELYEMLTAGEIDLLTDVSYTEERAEKILFSALGMGSENYLAYISPDNTEIRPDDYTSFNGKRVGVNKNSIQKQLFEAWAADQQISPEIIELTGRTPELLAMLERGEIDVLVTLDAYGNSADVVPVCKIGSADSYFGIGKNRLDLKHELDAAMNRILDDNRNFNQELAEAYAQAGGISHFLTTDEEKRASSQSSIRVGYLEAMLPFCATDGETESLTGTLRDFLSFAETCEKNAELSFETLPFETTDDALQALAEGRIDCLFPIGISSYDAEQRGILVTAPIISTEMFAVVRTADRQGISREEERTVAVPRENPSYEAFLMDCFPEWEAVTYKNAEEALLALANDEVSCVLVSNYRLNRISRLCTKYQLTTLTTGETMKFSFAMRREDTALYSILNKISRLFPPEMVNSSLTGYSFTETHVTLSEFIRDNLSVTIAFFAVVVLLLLLLLLWNTLASVRASRRRQLISEAERDPLTRLYNRSFFHVYVDHFHLDNPQKPMDAIVLNINRFHTLNTLKGRRFGDEVLRFLGREIGAFAQETGSIAGRLEGDHFDIYCPHRDDYQRLLARFQSRISEVAPDEDIQLRMGVFPWQEGTEPEQMFDRAWTACNMIRNDFRTNLLIYNGELEQRDLLEQRLSRDLSRALENREFEVCYQPKYDVRTDPAALKSAEALVRWQHPQLGTILPGDFVPLFEQNGQIGAVDSYVWDETARHIAAWRERYGFSLPVSVNLSRIDVFDPGLGATLDGIRERYGLEKGALCLEITESAYTEDADHLVEVIGQLREKGYEIEMDDFGSGYSSLNMLSSMPVDTLKMDMKFVQNIEHSETDLRLVHLILDIAKNLDLQVVAEGVETEGQLSLLKEAGCDLVQGYYFSPPLSASEFEKKVLSAAAVAKQL
ncbi:MAG: EAL domain-containing protein [Oscillospiraceae bacterium]|nr:EAL domain-containing protein [Oscillospiraceae bacterium]